MVRPRGRLARGVVDSSSSWPLPVETLTSPWLSWRFMKKQALAAWSLCLRIDSELSRIGFSRRLVARLKFGQIADIMSSRRTVQDERNKTPSRNVLLLASVYLVLMFNENLLVCKLMQLFGKSAVRKPIVAQRQYSPKDSGVSTLVGVSKFRPALSKKCFYVGRNPKIRDNRYCFPKIYSHHAPTSVSIFLADP